MGKTTYVFGTLRSFLAPPLRLVFEYCSPLRFLALLVLGLWLKKTVRIDGHTVHINPRDFGIAFELQSTGEYERKSMALCMEVLKPGMTFVDIGAHVGLYSLQAARRVGPTGRVFSFEPDAGNFSYLERNMKGNGYTNVTLLQQAVTDTTGPITLYQSRFNTGDHRTYFVSRGRRAVQIPGTTLDDFFADKPQTVDVIKIDIEGAEEAALRGMTETLERNPNVVLLIECCPDFLRKAGTDPTALLRSLAEKGFHLSLIDDTEGTVTPGNAASIVVKCEQKSYANVMCVRQ